jgi:hypothetical protein
MSEDDPIAAQDGINGYIEYVESYKVKKAFYHGFFVGAILAIIVAGVICLIV